MDSLKICGLGGAAVAAILTACSPEVPAPPERTFTLQLPPCCGAPPESLVHDPRILEQPRTSTIILVRVVKLETVYPVSAPPYAIGDGTTQATMLVLKSWRGPFSAGDVLHTPKGPFLAVNGNPVDYLSYPFQVGDQGKEFLIITNGGPNPSDGTEIMVRRYWAWPAAKSRALMAALDQAVLDSMPTDKQGYAARLQKELAAVEDVTTKLQAVRSSDAPEGEIADLSHQLWGHQENAARLQKMLRQLEDR
jgi:hypothetical protein